MMPQGARSQLTRAAESPVLMSARAAAWAEVQSLQATAWAAELQMVQSLRAAAWAGVRLARAAAWLAAQTSRAMAVQQSAALGPAAWSPAP